MATLAGDRAKVASTSIGTDCDEETKRKKNWAPQTMNDILYDRHCHETTATKIEKRERESARKGGTSLER